MKDPDETLDGIPLHDYGLALQNAVSWLGNRYLLAEPQQRRREQDRPWYGEQRRWHDVRRKPVQARH